MAGGFSGGGGGGSGGSGGVANANTGGTAPTAAPTIPDAPGAGPAPTQSDPVTPPVEIMPPDTPAGPPDIARPMAPAKGETWSLLNVILTIVTFLIMIVLLVTYFAGRRNKEGNNLHPALRFVTVATAVIAIVLLFLLENVTGNMDIVNSQSSWYAVITLVTIVLAVLSNRAPVRFDTAQN